MWYTSNLWWKDDPLSTVILISCWHFATKCLCIQLKNQLKTYQLNHNTCSLEFQKLLNNSFNNISVDEVNALKWPLASPHKGKTKTVHHWPFVRGIHWSPVDSPHKGPVMYSFGVYFVVTQTSSWTKSQVAGHLRCLNNHVISVLCWVFSKLFTTLKTPTSLPMSVTYGVCFVSSKCDLHSIAVIVLLFEISYYTAMYYDGTWLHLVKAGSQHTRSSQNMNN